MIKRLILAAVVGASLTGAALAQDKAAGTPDDCLKKAFELAQSAEQKKLSEAELESLETMLTKMEAHCDASEFDAADKVAAEAKALVNK